MSDLELSSYQQVVFDAEAWEMTVTREGDDENEYNRVLSHIAECTAPTHLRTKINRYLVQTGRNKEVLSFDDLIDRIDEIRLVPDFASGAIALEEDIRKWNRSAYAMLKELSVVSYLYRDASDGVACRIFYELYKSKIIYCNKHAYEFYEHGWNQKDVVSIESSIYTKLRTNLLNVVSILNRRIDDEDDPSDAVMQTFYDVGKWKRARENAGLILGSMEKNAFMKSVAVGLQNSFTVGEFRNLRDSKNVVRYADGVFDVDANRFREGRMDDFCVLCTNITYNNIYPSDDETMTWSYLRRIFTDVTILDFFLDFAATCLEPGNKEKMLVIFRGQSNGGKTFACTLLASLFGDYYARLPISALTGRRARGGSATPDMAMLENKLLAITQEPSSNDQLNLGVLKEITGNESDIYVRQLYEVGKQIRIKCKLVISMNPVTIATNLDSAAEGRLKVVPFTSTFTSDVTEPDEENRLFPVDSDAADKIPLMVPVVLAEMKSRYAKYRVSGLHYPQAILDATTEFLDENEPIVQFLGRYTRSAIGCINMAYFWDAYRTWYQESYPGTRCCNIKKFSDILERQGLAIQGEGGAACVMGIMDNTRRAGGI
jgi:phage/plasmid-associated DNA primase